jgi:hypothetical protein
MVNKKLWKKLYNSIAIIKIICFFAVPFTGVLKNKAQQNKLKNFKKVLVG